MFRSTIFFALWLIAALLIASITLHAEASETSRNSNNGVGSHYGWMTTWASGPNGEHAIRRIAIDMHAYRASHGEQIIPLRVPAGVTLNSPEDLALLNICLDHRPDACSNWPPSFDDELPGLPEPPSPPGNPGGPSPSEPAPDPPSEPAPGTVDCSVGTVAFEQYYSHNQWVQGTTYRRGVHYDPYGNCSNSDWGVPVITQKPVKP